MSSALVSAFKLAGLLLAVLVMETIFPMLHNKHIGVFIKNSPSVGWTNHMADRHFKPAGHLSCTLVLHLHTIHAFPVTKQHIVRKRNFLADIPSHSFGSITPWYYHTDFDVLILFNTMFPLLSLISWLSFLYHPASL